MQKIKNTLTKKEGGFTLIELLVVIAIIAVLASLVLAALSSAQKGSRDSKRRSDSNQIKTALVQYQADIGSYPADIATMGTTYLNPTPTAPQSGTAAAKTYAYFKGATDGFVISVQLERSTNFLWTTSTAQTDTNGSAATAANAG